jgi:hypothetical protein
MTSRRWEYTLFIFRLGTDVVQLEHAEGGEVRDGEPMDMLNRLGENGWEAVSFTESGAHATMRVLLKRPKDWDGPLKHPLYAGNIAGIPNTG